LRSVVISLMQTGLPIPRLFRPPVYQGEKNPDKYFEGWYFKLVDATGSQIWSIIPGISFSEDPHSFVQVIHANSGRTHYIRYDREAFRYQGNRFWVGIGPNEFTLEKLLLDLDTGDLKVQGTLLLEEVHPFPFRLWAPGIMGWYSYVPWMECYHGVVSMQHRIGGTLRIDGKDVLFDGGKGYIEKDWGKSMPSDWIWMQSNHFREDANASFMLSVARIPWRSSFFPGFLSFLLLDGKVYRFATYNRSLIRKIWVNDKEVRVELSNRSYRLSVRVMRKEGAILKAPRHGSMEREITESIVSSLRLELSDSRGKVLFSGRGQYAGLEIVGDVTRYFPS
jgi:tocopherol cyclase